MRHVLFGTIVLVVAAGVVGVGSPAFAQILRYVDEWGVTQYTGSEDQIPEHERAGAITAVLPQVIVQPDHTGSLKALADATIRLHSHGTPSVGDGPRPESGENARLQQAYVAREIARAQYLAQRMRDAYQKGCRFNANTMQEDCSGAWFAPLNPSTRGSLTDRSGKIP
jgi:hypothetical protein